MWPTCCDILRRRHFRASHTSHRDLHLPGSFDKFIVLAYQRGWNAPIFRFNVTSKPWGIVQPEHLQTHPGMYTFQKSKWIWGAVTFYMKKTDPRNRSKSPEYHITDILTDLRNRETQTHHDWPRWNSAYRHLSRSTTWHLASQGEQPGIPVEPWLNRYRWMIHLLDTLSRPRQTTKQEAWQLTIRKLLQIPNIFRLHHIPHRAQLFEDERTFILEASRDAGTYPAAEEGRHELKRRRLEQHAEERYQSSPFLSHIGHTADFLWSSTHVARGVVPWLGDSEVDALCNTSH